MKIAPRSRLLMIGDSITDCGRARPVGVSSGTGNWLGNGYVALIHALLMLRDPERQIQVINMGWGGNTVFELAGRWQTDVLDLKPDWVSIMIGVNDVAEQVDPNRLNIHPSPDAFERILGDLVVRTRPTVQGLVMMTPFYVLPERDDIFRATTDQYGGLVQRIARQSGAIFVDTQAVFDDLMRHYPAWKIAGDRVHPGLAGHLALAKAFLKAVEAP